MASMAWIRARSALYTLLEISLWFLQPLRMCLEAPTAKGQVKMNFKNEISGKVLKFNKYLFLIGKYLQQLDVFCNKILNQADDGDE